MIKMQKQQAMGINLPNSDTQPAGPKSVNTNHGFSQSQSQRQNQSGYTRMPSSMGKVAISQPDTSPTRTPIAKRYPKSAINAMNPNLNADPEPV